MQEKFKTDSWVCGSGEWVDDGATLCRAPALSPLKDQFYYNFFFFWRDWGLSKLQSNLKCSFYTKIWQATALIGIVPALLLNCS